MHLDQLEFAGGEIDKINFALVETARELNWIRFAFTWTMSRGFELQVGLLGLIVSIIAGGLTGYHTDTSDPCQTTRLPDRAIMPLALCRRPWPVDPLM